MTPVTKLDFIGVPSTDRERTRAFYVDTLGLRADPNARFEFWVGETCFGIWEPAAAGDRVHAAEERPPGAPRRGRRRRPRRAGGEGVVQFAGEILDTGVCHMALFTDPDGNDLMLHHRYAPLERGHSNEGEAR